MTKRRLSEIAESIVDGPFGSNLKLSDYVETGVPVLQGGNITGDFFSWKDVRYISPSKAKELFRSSVIVGDHLLVKIGSIGYSAIIDSLNGHEFAIIPANLARIRPNRKEIDDSYLHHWLKSEATKEYFRGIASKTAQPALSLSKIKDAQIPVLRLEEQKRIAAILDQADSLRRLRQRAIDRLSALGQAIFYQTFGDPATNPKGWAIGKIEDLTSSTQYGTSSKAGEVGELPILRMGNITESGGFDYSNLKYIDIPTRDLEKYTVRDGDILFNRTNSPDLVGKTGVYRGNQAYAFAGYLVRLRTNERAIPEYIGSYLNSPFGKKTLRGMCKTIIGMANINARELRSIPIPIVPIELQEKFQKEISQIQLLTRPLRVHLQQLERLFLSLQCRAFRGEL